MKARLCKGDGWWTSNRYYPYNFMGHRRYVFKPDREVGFRVVRKLKQEYLCPLSMSLRIM
jgi:hypothetical protein